MKLTTLRPRLATLGPTLRELPHARDRRPRGSTWMKTRARIMKRDGYLCRCADCQATDRVREAHEVDHVIPLWKGGSDGDANLAAIHRECHKVKTAREEAERRQAGL